MYFSRTEPGYRIHPQKYAFPPQHQPKQPGIEKLMHPRARRLKTRPIRDLESLKIKWRL
ncbi:3-oxoacyl-[acyl-carrier protein] reductase [Heyndrickxia coagulans]|nr:3-oxoacyl-[acyl-carrier protein] reductase [Heyndrickxia coagulans]KYC77716.1 3-oxoacyl-[acyl-carrier protein] reductase [Heyndrickxia coagulans]